MAEFVGADRGLRRLAVTAIDLADLELPPVVADHDTLAQARAKLEAAEARWAIVVDESEPTPWLDRHRRMPWHRISRRQG
ncbi:MAG: hypothetical protein WKF73_14360 [Nocardioidaceae bacterium]